MTDNKKKRLRFALKAMSLLLAVCMTAGAVYYFASSDAPSSIVSLISGEINLSDYEVKADTKKNIYVACGIHFGDDPEACCTPSSPNGFVIGETYVDLEKRIFTPHFAVPDFKELLIAQQTHLKLSEGLYIPCKEGEATILPYHVEITSNTGSIWEMETELDKIIDGGKDMFKTKAVNKGVKSLRYGAFSDATSASVYAGELNAILSEKISGLTVNISIPSGDGLCIIDKATGKILFEYDNGGDFTYAPAIYPINNSDGSKSGTTLASKRSYHDIMIFVRDGNMINTTNMVDLNTYVQGVLPSEIYASWAPEIQKAFSIIVRSYTISVLGGKHYNNYHVDMCATACCQAYKGYSGVTQKIIDAVNATGNKIMVSDGSLVTAYYAAVNGGESISNNYAWGGSARPHLPTQKTPWERYTEYSSNRGVWFKEFTPQELANELRASGYTAIKKPIASVSIDTRAGDTGYVYQSTYTDTAGNKVTITRTSKNYSALGLRSANFNIGKGSVDYFTDRVISVNIERMQNATDNPLMSLFNVITGSGIFSTDSGTSKVITGNGIFSLGSGANYALTADGIKILQQSAFEPSVPDENGYYRAINIYDDTVITTYLQRENLTFKPSTDGNFVIAGKGWGHGIGLSQYGANDLANFGAEYDQIIKAYYSNIDIISFEEYLAEK